MQEGQGPDDRPHERSHDRTEEAPSVGIHLLQVRSQRLESSVVLGPHVELEPRDVRRGMGHGDPGPAVPGLGSHQDPAQVHLLVRRAHTREHRLHEVPALEGDPLEGAFDQGRGIHVPQRLRVDAVAQVVAHVGHGRGFLSRVGVVERQPVAQGRDQHRTIQAHHTGGHVDHVVVGAERVVQLDTHTASRIPVAEGQRPGRIPLRQNQTVRGRHLEAELGELHGILAHHEPVHHGLGAWRHQLHGTVLGGQRRERGKLQLLQCRPVVAEDVPVDGALHDHVTAWLGCRLLHLLGHGVRCGGGLRRRRLLLWDQGPGEPRIGDRRSAFHQADRVGRQGRLRLDGREQEVGADHHQHHQCDRHEQAEFSSHRGCRLEEVSAAGAPGRGSDGGTGS